MLSKFRIFSILISFFLLIGCGSSSETFTPVVERPENWALKIEQEGLPNFYKVSDELYRGARPTAEGIKELEKMGIKTIINLETFHYSDKDKIEEADVEINYEQIPMLAWDPEDEDLIEFLEIISEKENGPFFVHCKHGADRTGLIVATYRIIEQDWSKEDAIKEMTDGGYGFHSIWDNLIEYIEETDFEELEKNL